MISSGHKQHVISRYARADCPECAADGERRLCERGPWSYKYVGFHLRLARAGLAGVGVKLHWTGDILDAGAFRREFVRALDSRIYLKGNPPVGRKFSPGYLERLDTFRSHQDGRYWATAVRLKSFAKD